jgi:hypothetical protein
VPWFPRRWSTCARKPSTRRQRPEVAEWKKSSAGLSVARSCERASPSTRVAFTTQSRTVDLFARRGRTGVGLLGDPGRVTDEGLDHCEAGAFVDHDFYARVLVILCDHEPSRVRTGRLVLRDGQLDRLRALPVPALANQLQVPLVAKGQAELGDPLVVLAKERPLPGLVVLPGERRLVLPLQQ